MYKKPIRTSFIFFVYQCTLCNIMVINYDIHKVQISTRQKLYKQSLKRYFCMSTNSSSFCIDLTQLWYLILYKAYGIYRNTACNTATSLFVVLHALQLEPIFYVAWSNTKTLIQVTGSQETHSFIITNYWKGSRSLADSSK